MLLMIGKCRYSLLKTDKIFTLLLKIDNDGRKGISRRRLEGQRQMEEKGKIIVKLAQEDVETSTNLLDK